MTDRLDRHPRVAALLDGPLGWHTVHHHTTVTSTSDVAHELAVGGAPPGLIVVADHQTAGRGRRGRAWDDRGGDGEVRTLLTSVVLPAPDRDVTLAPLAAGLAVADTLRRSGVTPALKWPNDVLASTDVGMPKCCGILVDRHDLAGGAVLVVGVGIDLDWRDQPRDGDASAWTSVAEVTGRAVDRGDVLADLLRGLAVWTRSILSDPERLLVTYRSHCATIGQQVRITFPDGEQLEGQAVDLERAGRLVVDSPALGKVAVTAGDVEHVRPT